MSLNQIVWDLRIANTALHDYEQRVNRGDFKEDRELTTQLLRMCICHEVLALCLFQEVAEVYGDVIPRHVKPHVKGILGEMRVRKVKAFRSAVVAHLLDENEAWVPPSEVDRRRIEDLERGEPGSFSYWITSWPGDGGPEIRAMQRIEQIRDAIATAHGISHDEMVRALKL